MVCNMNDCHHFSVGNGDYNCRLNNENARACLADNHRYFASKTKVEVNFESEFISTKNIEENLRKDLIDIVNKYGLTNAVFGADLKDRFIGLIGVAPINDPTDFFKVVISGARLYQACREKVFMILDKISK